MTKRRTNRGDATHPPRDLAVGPATAMLLELMVERGITPEQALRIGGPVQCSGMVGFRSAASARASSRSL
jgi:hypothetical protein